MTWNLDTANYMVLFFGIILLIISEKDRLILPIIFIFFGICYYFIIANSIWYFGSPILLMITIAYISKSKLSLLPVSFPLAVYISFQIQPYPYFLMYYNIIPIALTISLIIAIIKNRKILFSLLIPVILYNIFWCNYQMPLAYLSLGSFLFINKRGSIYKSAIYLTGKYLINKIRFNYGTEMVKIPIRCDYGKKE